MKGKWTLGYYERKVFYLGHRIHETVVPIINSLVKVLKSYKTGNDKFLYNLRVQHSKTSVFKNLK